MLEHVQKSNHGENLKMVTRLGWLIVEMLNTKSLSRKKESQYLGKVRLMQILEKDRRLKSFSFRLQYHNSICSLSFQISLSVFWFPSNLTFCIQQSHDMEHSHLSLLLRDKKPSSCYNKRASQNKQFASLFFHFDIN